MGIKPVLIFSGHCIEEELGEDGLDTLLFDFKLRMDVVFCCGCCATAVAAGSPAEGAATPAPVLSVGVQLDFRPIELMMEVDLIGFLKGCILTEDAPIMRNEAANIWEVVPTVSYFFSFT